MTRPAKRVLLIGWDGADWKMITPLLDDGKMPNLERLINNGVMGNISTLEPVLSPVLWTTIATGKYADRHQVLGFAEPDGTTGKIRPVSSSSRRCKALWNILSENGLKCGVINWFTTYPAEEINGFVVSDRFGYAHYGDKILDKTVYPERLKDDLESLIIKPHDITPLQLAPFILKPQEIDIKNDKNFHTLVRLLAQSATTHNIATYLMEREEWDFMCVYYPEIDRFAHAFMEYAPPKMDHVSDKDFQHYHFVVEGCYRYHDLMLGRLLELAGEDTTVVIVSDHGFRHEESRPKASSKIIGGQPVAWHRKFGILAMRGQGIKKDIRIYGASILDVASTVLALVGVPVPRDMDGNVLRQIFEDNNLKFKTVETYEKAFDETDSKHEIDDPWSAQEVLKNLAALGYIDLSGTDEENIEKIFVDRIKNLSCVYTTTNRPELALKELKKLPSKHKNNNLFKLAKAINLLNMNQYDKAEAVLNEVFKDERDGPQINYYMGLLKYHKGKHKEALKHLRKAETYEKRNPHLYCKIGEVYLRMEKCEEAQEAFLMALEIDDENAPAYDGLGVTYRKLGEPEKAVEAHMRSVALLHYQPMAHCHLGLALAEVGHIDWAIRAFNVAIELAPKNPVPHRLLGELYEKVKKDNKKAKIQSTS